jgi:hypothetical protein
MDPWNVIKMYVCKKFVTISEKATSGRTYLRRSIKWGRIEEAFEEGQDPHRAVEPVMMMMRISQRMLTYIELEITST